MSTVLAGPAVSFANTILSYFSPSKSPFYSVIVFGTVALVLSCGLDDNVWLQVVAPVYLVLSLALILSFQNRPVFLPGEHEEQLRFARSFSISIALIFFVLTALATFKNPLGFWISYVACLTQIMVFLLYTWARSQSEEEDVSVNFVQFALITTTYLVGASYADWKYSEKTSDSASGDHYFLVMLGLYFLWLCCIFIWLKHLHSLIRVLIPGRT